MNNLTGIYNEANRGDLANQYIRPRTFGEAVEYAGVLSARKLDMYTDASNIHFCEDGLIPAIVEDGSLWGSIVKPFSVAVASPNAIEHMVTMLGVPGLNRRFIMDGAPTEMAAYVMNEFLNVSSSKWKPRFHIGDDGMAVLRAVGSGKYNARLNNYDILSALASIPRRDGTPQFPDEMPLAGTGYYYPSYIDRDSMRIQMKVGGKIELPDLPGGRTSFYGYGIRIGNDEVKRGSAYASFILWRGECDNSIVVPFAAYKKSHSGTFLAATFAHEAMAAIASALQGSGGDDVFDIEAIAQVAAEASRHELSTNGALDVIETFISTFSLGDEAEGDILDVARRYAQNRLGLAGAITEYAHRVEDPTKQADIERAAGVFVFDYGNFKNLKRALVEDEANERLERVYA